MEELTPKVIEEIMQLLNESRDLLYEDLEKSLELADRAFKLSQQENHEEGLAISLVRKAAVYRVKGELEKSAELSYKAKHMLEEQGNDIHLVDVLNNLGNIFADNGDYDTALSFYMESSKILETQYDDKTNYFRYVINNNIGEIYNELHSYDTAIEYYEKSLNYIKDTKQKKYIVVPYINIAEVYQKIKDFDRAILYVNKALKISEEASLKFFKPDIFFCLAKIYSSKDMFEDAHENFQKAIELLKEQNLVYFLVIVQLEFYSFLLRYKKTEEALEILKEAHKTSINNNYKMKLSKIYSNFAEFYENNKKYREALNYYKYYSKEEKQNQVKEVEKKVLHLKNQLKLVKIEHEKDLVQLKNVRLTERTDEVEKLYNDIKVISEMGQEITSVLDLDKVVSKTEKHFKKILDLVEFGLVIYDDSGKNIEFSFLSVDGIKNNGKQLLMEKSFREFHMGSGREKMVFKGEKSSERFVSLIIEERVIGGVYLKKRTDDEYLEQDITIMKAFVNYVAIALNNAQKSMILKDANQKLLSLSLKDGLTEIANRRRFEEVAKREWWRAVRYKTPMSIIIFDIDRFKQYNDNYGHLEGDECIKKIAKTADAFFKRAIDLVARYGGDEFVVVLPDTDLESSVELAEKLRAHIEDELRLIHDYSDISNFVTITLGVSSTYPSSNLSEKKLLDVADSALYNAKESGRNRVEFLLLSSN